ncbi:MAG: prolipoprotein diacylglyceryl transferase [Chloroflexi bacterium]|nr:prolipoprotein diacylglyceryl transferase [Chloroflexota bacterium]
MKLFQNLFAPPRHMILLIIAAWLGLTLAERRAEKHGISKDDLNNITFYGLLAFVIGGRITYVSQNIAAFSKSPLGIFSINPDLFDPFGGLAVAFIVALVYGQRKQIRFWNALDALTPFFAILAIGLALSHFAAGTAFGTPATLPWGIDLWNAIRHPTQLYDALASFVILALLWRFKPGPRPGLLFLLFAALTALAQLVTQAFRADSVFVLAGLRQAQVIAWVVLAVSFIVIEARFSSPKQKRAGG